MQTAWTWWAFGTTTPNTHEPICHTSPGIMSLFPKESQGSASTSPSTPESTRMEGRAANQLGSHAMLCLGAGGRQALLTRGRYLPEGTFPPSHLCRIVRLPSSRTHAHFLFTSAYRLSLTLNAPDRVQFRSWSAPASFASDKCTFGEIPHPQDLRSGIMAQSDPCQTSTPLPPSEIRPLSSAQAGALARTLPGRDGQETSTILLLPPWAHYHGLLTRLFLSSTCC